MWTLKESLESIYKLAQCWLFIALRFPSLSQEYIKCNLSKEKNSIRPDQWRIILANASTAHKWPTILIMSAYFVYAMRNISFVLFAYSMYDYDDLQSNLIKWPSPRDNQTLFKFTCLQTNCTTTLTPVSAAAAAAASAASATTTQTIKLFASSQPLASESSSLAQDLSRLPLFSLCHPLFDSFMSPIVRLESFGLLAFTGSAFYVLFLGIFIPFKQLISPAALEALMFMSAPEVSIGLMRGKCKQLAVDLAASYWNFCARQPETHLHFDARSKWSRRKRSTMKGSSYYISQRHRNHHRLPLECGFKLGQPPHSERDDDRKRQQQLIDDCMPLIRSHWWHSKLLVTFCTQFIATSIGVAVLILIIFHMINERLAQKAIVWKEFQRQTEANKCNLWTLNDGHSSNNYLNLSQINIGWTYLQSFETGWSNFFPGFSTAMISMVFWVIISELSCWLAELQTYLLVCLTCCRFKTCPCCRRANFQQLRASKFSVPEMRRQFVGQVRLFGCFLAKNIGNKLMSINSESGEAFLEASVVNKLIQLNGNSLECKRKRNRPSVGSNHLLNDEQMFIEEETVYLDDLNQNDDHDHDHHQLQDQDDELNVEILEQIYIQFRLFMDYVGNLSDCITLFASIIYILTYGLVLIGVFFSSRVKNLTIEPVVLIVVGWMSSNVFIILAANFHANTKRLQSLIWSIIAQLAHSKSARVCHIRLLWTKQMFSLDMEGEGVAMKAFKIRITYVNLIQVLIWTGTILVITLKAY